MRTTCFAIVLTLLGGAALARDVQPKPGNGPVYHLFGPNSLSTNFLPSAGSAGGTKKSADGTGTGYVEPSTHDILHQLFVTGDPDAKPGASLPKGRAANPAN